MFILFVLASCFPVLAVDGGSDNNNNNGGSDGGPPPRRKGKEVEADDGTDQCTICLEPLEAYNNHRTVVTLQCGHTFHLDCIGSAFNMKRRMECPNCRAQEEGQWRYASGVADDDNYIGNPETIHADLQRVAAMIIERISPIPNDDLSSVRGVAANLNRPARQSADYGVQFEPVTLRSQAPSDTRYTSFASNQSRHLPESMYAQASRASPYASANIHRERTRPVPNDDLNFVSGIAAYLNRPSVARHSADYGVQFEPVTLRPRAASDTHHSSFASNQSSHFPESMYAQALRASPYASANIHSFGPRVSDLYGSQMAPTHFSANYPHANHGYVYSGYPYAYAPMEQQNHTNSPELTSRNTHIRGSYTEGVQTTRRNGRSTSSPRRSYQVPPVQYMPTNVNMAQQAPHLAIRISSSSMVTGDRNYSDSAGPSSEGGSGESPPDTPNMH